MNEVSPGKPAKVSIETAHPYTSDDLRITGDAFIGKEPRLKREMTAFEQACARVGNSLADLAEQMGFETTTHVLIDDVTWAAAQEKSAEPHRWSLFRNSAEMGAELAYSPDAISSEAAYKNAGVLLADLLRNISGKEGASHIRLHTQSGRQRIRLTGFKEVADPEHPSCDVLDLAWHQDRAKEHRVLLNVLHESYAGQQDRVDALFALLPNTDPSISSALLLL